ncbi:LSU ribosomal protein L2P [Candidatus Nitrososphaera evergladensis SR1]|jgi:large subunit ribosomal protein L2|uniref:Large ribosomal subunit protein uL2 n=1 Tax=Candidatus Nitrososphaera evergladensis SR1 TaxID=1459636 RepID=A0A075MTW4_9ARCH|nr:50S ribosomal protein L2 [Candidatus Nitrososphaera evergladensis]AIF85086.1 LSU ribosomal protein L2P [Candidatus Nitrososphaera evergladensis SR1]
MGKRTLVRRRGRGGKQFRAIIVGKIAPAKYPNFKLEENHKGTVVDIVHERGRDAPLAKVSFDDGRHSYVPAPEGTIVGSTIQVGQGSPATKGNILALESVPDGTLVCNIEKNAGDGGKLIKAAGSGAIVFAHGTEGVTIKFPSGKFLTLNAKCRAMIGTIAGAGRKEKPFLKAGNRAKYMQAHGRLYPTVRGIAQAAVYHPHGGGRHQHIGRQSSVSRNTPPGRKVGNIAPKKTGRGRIKEVPQKA